MTTGRTSIDMGRVLETGPEDQKLWLQDHLRDLEAVLEGFEERLSAIETSLGGPPPPGEDWPLTIVGEVALLRALLAYNVPTPWTDEYRTIVTPTFEVDGDHFTVLNRADRYIPAVADENVDARDLSLDVVEVSVVTVTLTNDYNDMSNTLLAWGLQLAERSTHTSRITVNLYRNGGFVASMPEIVRSNGQSQWVSDVHQVTNPAASGDTLEIRVAAIGDHPNVDPWIEGSVRESWIRIAQG